MRPLLTALALVVILALGGHAGDAQAHAHLRTATPASGGIVQASPPEVAITFTEGVEPRFSTIEVHDAAGKRVDKDDVRTTPADNKVLRVGVPQLAPGTYTVTWRVTAVDTHRTEGTFQFTIRP